jgi:transposase InsO family protein
MIPTASLDAAGLFYQMKRTRKGTEATMGRLRRSFWFPSMVARTVETLASCRCCLVKTTLNRQLHNLNPTLSGYPFQKLFMDFVGPLPLLHPGRFKYILTIRDIFTKWTEAFPTRDMTAATVVRLLAHKVFPRFGTPEHIHTDQGTQFTSHLLKEVALAFNIKLATTPAYNPKSNPVE